MGTALVGSCAIGVQQARHIRGSADRQSRSSGGLPQSLQGGPESAASANPQAVQSATQARGPQALLANLMLHPGDMLPVVL
jgi:hypothetical protein